MPAALSSRRTGYALCVVLTAVALGLEFGGAGHVAVFIGTALALMALAWLVGVATEELGTTLGPAWGGVLNQTCANLPELIISFLALRAGLVDVVKASITGSIIGNLLLVLGVSLLAGGLRHGTLRFSRQTAGLNSTMLVIAVIALFVPAVFGSSIGSEHGDRVRHLSDAVAVVLIVLYALSLIFFFANPRSSVGAAIEADEPEPSWGPMHGIAVLVGAAVVVALLSEILVDALEPTIQTWGVSETFAGLIIIPICGNMAENMVAVRLALKNAMDFSLLVSVGSSLQVAVFVAPVLVLLSHLAGTPMDLVFTQLEQATVALTVVLVALIALDGESNWFEGAELLAVYAIVALAFFFYP